MNNLSGPIENWIGLTSLSRLIVQPGNPGLCTYRTTQLPFSICTSTDVSCLVQIPQLESCTSNQTVPGTSSGNSTGNTTTTSGASTSSGVSAVAIAVPIAVGVPLVAGVGCFLLLFVRKRRRDRTSEEDQRDKRDDQREGHPFDTFEGQETMTSPFAGTIFRRGCLVRLLPLEPLQVRQLRKTRAVTVETALLPCAHVFGHDRLISPLMILLGKSS